MGQPKLVTSGTNVRFVTSLVPALDKIVERGGHGVFSFLRWCFLSCLYSITRNLFVSTCVDVLCWGAWPLVVARGYAFAPTQLDHAEAGGAILVDAGASFADAVRSHGDPNVLAMSDLLLIVNTADMMCGPDGVPVSFDERLSDVEARYGVGSRQAVDVGVMLDVLRRELEMRGVSVEAAERAGVERVDTESEFPESAAGAEGVSAADVDAADAVDSL